MQMGFGEKLRAWVKGCVCTAKVSVLINGSPTKEFKLGKGVRQGDPLAPFLFILATERLNVMLWEALRKNIFKGVGFDNSDEEVYMFQYADDTIFIGEWDSRNAKSLIRILKCFEVCSGLKINMNLHQKDEIARMAHWLHRKEEPIPFVYLGLSVGGNMNRSTNWQPIIDRFKSRLSHWKSKTLSIGGRLCLCKSVLGSLGAYSFSLYIPKGVLNTLEDSEGSKKIKWVAWDRVINNKKCGGLGIGSLRACNLALLAKWWWRERVDADCKWKSVVLNCRDNRRNTNGIWTKICGIDKELGEMGINLHRLMHRKEDGSGWDWDLEKNKIYSVCSLRKLIDTICLPSAIMETVWINWLPSKINIHVWRTLTNRLATLDNLDKWGVVLQSKLCPMCLSMEENLDHVMTCCSTTRIVCAHFVLWVDWWSQNELSVQGIWSSISNPGGDHVRKQVRQVIVAALFWNIWIQRNRMAFQGTIKKEKEIFLETQYTAFDWIRNRCKFGKSISLESWVGNPLDAVSSCNTLAPR
ncbi:hypothetical protein OSB04_002121 [Centaurea solstitialis]|uniref:Reverse transcriptase domain-containing protein n=1 Tax=Centaurea solstitialis TaxID=347529 RepID=A0AA38U417_9ASTR|nr:hypothetical protein OSB04_002121 [Centaurea solstitialis]